MLSKPASEESEKEAALEMARKWGLIDADGNVWCSHDGCDRHALLPSLACPVHLAAYRRVRP